MTGWCEGSRTDVLCSLGRLGSNDLEANAVALVQQNMPSVLTGPQSAWKPAIGTDAVVVVLFPGRGLEQLPAIHQRAGLMFIHHACNGRSPFRSRHWHDVDCRSNPCRQRLDPNGVFIAGLFLLGALAVIVLANGDRVDERRAWSKAWLTALEPLYSLLVAKASFFEGRRRCGT